MGEVYWAVSNNSRACYYVRSVMYLGSSSSSNVNKMFVLGRSNF